MNQDRSQFLEGREGFTLIELLIVVAIIAILAAIAVPNFMEAQTRAKVAHAMANMRSLAVGIEAYKTDTNSYPLDWHELWKRSGTYPPSMSSPILMDETLFVLTTPVAYISSIPADPFVMGRTFRFYPKLYEKRYSRYVSRGGAAWNRYGGILYPGGYFYPPHDHFRYLLVSPGPDLWLEYYRHRLEHRESPLPYSGDTLYYDPTNGSRSQGDILMYGPGNAFNPPPPTDYPNGEFIKDWYNPVEPDYPL